MAIAQEVAGKTWRMFIGGEWVEASNRAHMEVMNPAHGDVMGRVPLASAEDVGHAAEAAKAAFPGWWHMGAQERGARLRKLGKLIRERLEDLAWLDAANGGNPLRTCRADVARSAARCDEVASLVLEVKGMTVNATTPNNLHYMVREPYGVAGVIMPFNHPFAFALDIAGPLVVGNTVILKPPDQAPLSSLVLAELVEEVFPPGVINIVTGDGATTGAAISRHPDVQLITFRGSIPTGQRIIQLGAEQAIKTNIMELGGKNALIVCPDADFDKAARAAVTGMNLQASAGQSCMSTSRVLVHKSMRKEFVDSIEGLYGEISLGNPVDPNTQMGTLVTQAHLERVMGYVKSGIDQGARLVMGGSPPTDPEFAKGAYLPPTMFDNVDPSMKIAQEEIFGPVVSIIEWESEEQTLAIANSVRWGLTASIWTKDLARAHRMASQIQAGRVFVNHPIGGFPRMSYSAYKDSGVGVEGGVEGLTQFTQLKSINIINETP